MPTIYKTVFRYLPVMGLLILSATCGCKKALPIETGISDSAHTNIVQTATAINAALRRGINLGNIFEAPQGETWGTYDSAYFQTIAQKGFKHVRIPIRWERNDRSSPTFPYDLNESFVDTIKSVVDAALRQGLYVIINMHHHEQLMADPDGQKQRFLYLWSHIAWAFKDYPNKLLFEILNEPHGNMTADKWNSFSAEALQWIRNTENPTRTVLLGTADWGGLSKIQALVIPNDTNLILTLHYYEPMQFTHQGADWVAGADSWLGTKWLDTDVERAIVNDHFKTVIQKAAASNIPVHIGEFGAITNADSTSRVKWMRFMARWFEQQGFSWAYWNFADNFFGIYNPSAQQFNTPVLNALMSDPMPSPGTLNTTTLYTSNFSAGPDSWNLYNNDASASATVSINSNKATISITQPGTADWHIQFVRWGFALEAGKTYHVSFYASSTVQKTISSTLAKSSTPYTVYSNNDVFTIDPTDHEYHYIFKAPVADATANMLFSLGNIGATNITLHDIKLQEVHY